MFIQNLLLSWFKDSFIIKIEKLFLNYYLHRGYYGNNTHIYIHAIYKTGTLL